MDKTTAAISGASEGEPKMKRIATIPMGRPGTADEVAKVALFLASDDASYVHGQVLNVNGGDFMSYCCARYCRTLPLILSSSGY